MISASTFLERSVQRALLRTGLTPPQFYILAMLAQMPDVGITPKAIQGEAKHRANLTQTFDRMERDGLVERVPNPADRRSVLIRITRRGLKVDYDAAGIYRNALPGLVSALSTSEQQTCLSLLGVLSASFQAFLRVDD